MRYQDQNRAVPLIPTKNYVLRTRIGRLSEADSAAKREARRAKRAENARRAKLAEKAKLRTLKQEPRHPRGTPVFDNLHVASNKLGARVLRTWLFAGT